MQHEITKAIPLLNEHGNLTEPGFARKLLPVYDRTKVKRGFNIGYGFAEKVENKW